MLWGILFAFHQNIFAQATNTLTTGNGSITFGPSTSADHADITTNKSRFMFMKSVYANSGNFSSSAASTLNLQVNGVTQLSFNPAGQAWFSSTKVFLPNNSFLFMGGGSIGSPRFSINFWNNTNTYIDYHRNLFFRTDAGAFSPLVLQENGNVFIGLNTQYSATVDKTQGFRLAVNGGILCEEVKVVEDVPQSDYVFEPTYKLMPLDSVEAFLMANKHLPEVPSAAEFKQNGYKVGEMDDLLLRKVEELTLYIIKLQKQVQALKQKTGSTNTRRHEKSVD